MNEYSLDTDILIEFLNGNKEIARVIEEHKDSIVTTPINLGELYKGAYTSERAEKNLMGISKILQSVPLLMFDRYACELYGKVYAELKRKGRLIKEFDILIAAICIANNATLVTRNTKHFKLIKELSLESW